MTVSNGKEKQQIVIVSRSRARGGRVWVCPSTRQSRVLDRDGFDMLNTWLRSVVFLSIRSAAVYSTCIIINLIQQGHSCAQAPKGVQEMLIYRDYEEGNCI